MPHNATVASTQLPKEQGQPGEKALLGRGLQQGGKGGGGGLHWVVWGCSRDDSHVTWMRRLWHMLQSFMASGCVSRMYCSISRMARLCRVKSPSFCRDTVGATNSGHCHARPFPARSHPLCHPTAQGPERCSGLAAPAS